MKIRSLFIFTLLITSFIIAQPVLAQEAEYEIDSTEIIGDVYLFAEKQPQYPGGMDAFYRFVDANLDYPSKALKKKVQGKVYVQFTVLTDGEITDVRTIKGLGYGCDQEAERLIKSAGKWVPGSHKGQSVKVRMDIPFTFTLDKVN
ncbi:energy transducer TonB [Fulvivirgaceae bacterium BMA10]|uniref:Energy transducer TonB n=1 Tax=Splendidivirga corallicola TaxID=3051826 RepID=A0ABT8L0R3_9BACT|nr:energy transducer TonB [Fulvivirgaceae bacterium BMA10]